MGKVKTIGKKEKTPRRNSEQRKLKSRDAARCRRGKESDIFNELVQVLPPEISSANPDKSSIMRLALAYLKLNSLVNLESFKNIPELINNNNSEEAGDLLTPDTVGGFLFVLSANGDMVFISKNCQEYLGVSQVEMMGHTIYDFSHPCDHDEIKELLAHKYDGERSKFVRFKCALNSKGRAVNLKSASYKVIHCCGRLFGNKKKATLCSPYFLIALGLPIPHPSNVDAPLCSSSVFLSKHSLDLRFTYIDKDIKKFLGYDTVDILGQSIFNYFYALDGKEAENSYKTMFSKGQVETKPYRFLAKNGGWVWVTSQATVLYTNNKPEEVIQINYVLSSVENADAVVSSEQVKQGEGVVEGACTGPSGPQPSTKSTFAPLTDEMNKGFLVFADDDPSRTLLKDEPDIEDLTNLAPSSGGETCVPLDVPSFEVFDDLLFPDGNSFLSYRDDCPSSQPDSPSSKGDLSSPSSLDKCGNPSSIDSFGSQLTPPSSSVHSPDSDISEGSPAGKFSLAMDLCSPSGSPLDSEEYTSRAPYIPMGVADDLPLLANDLMWSATSPSSVSSVKSADSDPSSTSSPTSSLAQLLQTQQSAAQTIVQQNLIFDTGQKPSRLRDGDGMDTSPSPKSPSNSRHSTAYHLKRTLPIPEPLGQVRNSVTGKDCPTPVTKRVRTNEVINSGAKVIVQTVSAAKVSMATTATQTSPLDTLNSTTMKALTTKMSPITLNLCTMQNGQQVIGIIQANKLLSPQKQIQALREQQQQLLEQQEEQRRREWEAKARASVAPEMRDSVLLNLLISGKDVGAGYSCPGKAGKMKSPGVGAPVFGSLLGNCPSSSLSEITQQDCDVNAPVLGGSSHLLQGADLLQALDSI